MLSNFFMVAGIIYIIVYLSATLVLRFWKPLPETIEFILFPLASFVIANVLNVLDYALTVFALNLSDISREANPMARYLIGKSFWINGLVKIGGGALAIGFISFFGGLPGRLAIIATLAGVAINNGVVVVKLLTRN